MFLKRFSEISAKGPEYSCSQCSAKERELLEELASLNGSPIARTKTQPKVQQAGMHEIFSSLIISGTCKGK